MAAVLPNVLAVSTYPDLTESSILLRLVTVLLLIAINAFFVTVEFSLVSVRRTRIHQLVEAGDVQAITVQGLQLSIERLLSTTQLGITLSSLALGWIGESTMGVLVASWIAKCPMPTPISSFLGHSLSIPIAFVLIAYLQIVLGELCPKSVALLYSEQLARFLGPPVRAIARFFSPFIWILNQSTRCLLRLVGINYTGQGWRPPVTSEELQLIISTERESTGLEAEERELLNNIFEFGDVTAEEVMVPRTSIVALPITATLQTLLEEMAATRHSHYPVTGKSLDDIRGIVHFKDLAEPLVQGKISLETEIQPWIRPALFVPQYTPLSELLPMMQRLRYTHKTPPTEDEVSLQPPNSPRTQQQPMVMVVDEFGGTAGLITIQDLIAEIIGDTNESENTHELMIQRLDEQTFLVQAQTNLQDLNELFGLNLPLANEYQTVGGFLLYQMQKIPVPGESLRYQNLELTIISVAGPRLHQIQIQRLAED